MFFLFIVNLYYLSITSALPEMNCVSPPMECPNTNITFWLYTRENQNNPHQLFATDPNSIETAPWVQNAPIKILIHGYTGHKDFSPNTEIRPAYMKCCDYNVISVDYNPIAREPCYFQAARNTELVGLCTAQLVDELIMNYGFKIEHIHPIGFSLGGQTVGFLANKVKSGRFPRITALDPAMPLFVTTSVEKKVDATDAEVVDVLHTNALEKGKLEASGTVDFYANGGMNQPGCAPTAEQTTFHEMFFGPLNVIGGDPIAAGPGLLTHVSELILGPAGFLTMFSFTVELVITKSGCEHARAPAYYAESITTQTGFYSMKCYSWVNYMIGWCEQMSDEEILFGEYMPYNVSGLYFFTTNSESPYARGRSKSETERRKQ